MSRQTDRRLDRPDDIIVMDGIRKVYDTGKVKVEALKGVDLHGQEGRVRRDRRPVRLRQVDAHEPPRLPRHAHERRRTASRGEKVAGLSRDALADVRNRRVGFVFQNFNLLPQITALENVEMPMLFGGIPPKERRKRSAELLAKVGLGDRLEHRPTELSGGQMQRVAVARALAMTPDMLLADEPTGNLDSTSGGDIMDVFAELWRAGGTLVVITHDMSLARRAGRVIEVHDGRILKDSAREAA